MAEVDSTVIRVSLVFGILVTSRNGSPESKPGVEWQMISEKIWKPQKSTGISQFLVSQNSVQHSVDGDPQDES